MNPDLFEQLRAFLGPSRTASTPLPPVRVTAPAREMTMGPSSGTASVGDEPVLPRLAAELGIGMTPAGAAPDAARAIQDAAEGDWRGAAGNAAMAALGIVPLGRVGKGARKAWEAWHGSPQRGINQLQRSSAGMTGQAAYIAGSDPFGVGRQQAMGYAAPGLNAYVNVRGRAIPEDSWLQVAEALGRDKYDEPVFEATKALTMARRRLDKGLYPRSSFTDPDTFNRYRDAMREHWLDVLSERSDMYKGRGVPPAQQAAQLVEAGDLDINRPALYRLAVDADRERMLDFDAPWSEQPEFVRDALMGSNDPSINAPLSRVLNSDIRTGRNLLNAINYQLKDDYTKAREALEGAGIEGVSAHGGDFPIPSALRNTFVGADNMAPSTQYAIFNPERIRILEMLAAAGIVPAANALAQMREPTTPVPPEG